MLTMIKEIENFVKTNPNTDFIDYIKVGNRGISEFYTDKSKYEARHSKVWDSGHDFTAMVVKDLNH